MNSWVFAISNAVMDMYVRGAVATSSLKDLRDEERVRMEREGARKPRLDRWRGEMLLQRAGLHLVGRHSVELDEVGRAGIEAALELLDRLLKQIYSELEG